MRLDSLGIGPSILLITDTVVASDKTEYISSSLPSLVDATVRFEAFVASFIVDIFRDVIGDDVTDNVFVLFSAKRKANVDGTVKFEPVVTSFVAGVINDALVGDAIRDVTVDVAIKDDVVFFDEKRKTKEVVVIVSCFSPLVVDREL